MTGKRWLLVFGAFLVLTSFVLVGATLSGVSLTAPADNANISGTYSFNSTITGTAATNVTVYWWNSTDSTWNLICYDDGGGGGPFSCSYDTTNIPDGTGNVFNVTAVNGTASALQTDNNTGVTIDNTDSSISISSPVAGWHRQNISVYANASDATTNITNSTIYFWFGNSTGNFSKTLFTSCGYVSVTTGFNCSAAFNTTLLADGNYTLWVNASDTVGNVNYESLSSLGIDNTIPAASASCSPSTIRAGEDFPCTCSGTDATSGTSASTSSTSGSITSTEDTGSFTYSCTITDGAGNTASSSATYIVNSRNSGSSGGVSQSTPGVNPPISNIFTKITPGAVVIMKNFDNNTGIKEIQIEVNNPAQNVKITVTRYDSKPANVSVEKSGSVYQYLHVKTENLGNLSNATIRFKVLKTWVLSNLENKSSVAVFKFNETSNKWMELPTKYSGEDNNFYYYDVHVNSFSYFAISEQSLAPTEQTNTSSSVATTISNNKNWLWPLLAVIVLFAVWRLTRKKK